MTDAVQIGATMAELQTQTAKKDFLNKAGGTWLQHFDKGQGKPCWYHSVTNQAVWDKPTPATALAAQPYFVIFIKIEFPTSLFTSFTSFSLLPNGAAATIGWWLSPLVESLPGIAPGSLIARWNRHVAASSFLPSKVHFFKNNFERDNH
jgi:hypothetical protein